MGLNRPNDKGVICVDSKNLCVLATEKKSGLVMEDHSQDNALDFLLNFPQISIFYINREWNCLADTFAKKGKNRDLLIGKWL